MPSINDAVWSSRSVAGVHERAKSTSIWLMSPAVAKELVAATERHASRAKLCLNCLSRPCAQTRRTLALCNTSPQSNNSTKQSRVQACQRTGVRQQFIRSANKSFRLLRYCTSRLR
jgi:hypothetical protein